MNSPLLFVGLDVGGTTMKAAVVDDMGHVSHPRLCRPRLTKGRYTASIK